MSAPYRSLASRYGMAALSGEVERIGIQRSHKSVYAAACQIGQLVAGGEVDEDLALSHLLPAALQARPKASEIELRRTIRAGLNRGMREPRTAPEGGTMLASATEARVAVYEWWEAACAHGWVGRAAPTTLAILGAFAHWGMRIGKVRFGLSLRQIAEAAGVSVATVHDHRDQTRPWIRLVRRGNALGQDSIWQLVIARAIPNMPKASIPAIAGVFGSDRALSHPGHDAWYGSKAGWLIWSNLLAWNEPPTARELAAALPMSAATVRRRLAWLDNAGLASCDADGCWSPTGRDDVLRLTSPGDERRRRFENDRQRFSNWQSGRARSRVSQPPGAQAQRAAPP